MIFNTIKLISIDFVIESIVSDLCNKTTDFIIN